MREILFRGKHVDNGKWVEQYVEHMTIMLFHMTKKMRDLLLEIQTLPW